MLVYDFDIYVSGYNLIISDWYSFYAPVTMATFARPSNLK